MEFEQLQITYFGINGVKCPFCLPYWKNGRIHHQKECILPELWKTANYKSNFERKDLRIHARCSECNRYIDGCDMNSCQGNPLYCRLLKQQCINERDCFACWAGSNKMAEVGVKI